MISNKAKKQIDTWVAKYPTGRQSSAVMEALKIVQAENGNSLSAERMVTTSDNMCPFAISSMAAKCANPGARIFTR
jgi:NADH-quinone oxidoreductase subunit E